MGSLFVGAYWGDRAASKEECAATLAKLLDELSSVDARLSMWFPKGLSAKKGTPVSLGALDNVLRISRRDVDRSAIDELGFSFGLWNGDSSFGVSLTGRIGGFAGSAVPNNCVLSLPSDAESDPDLVRRIVCAMVNQLAPDRCVATTPELLALGGEAVPAVGWITFVPTDVTGGDLSVSACCGGSIVQLGPDPRLITSLADVQALLNRP